MTRVAVVGLGIGQRHLAEYARNAHAEIVGVVDVDAAKCAEVAQRYGVPGYSSLDELLQREAVEAISLCTPPALHAPQVEACAAAGVHVLVEKPMAPSIEDCLWMVDSSLEAGVVLMVGQKKRFSSPYAFIKAMCDAEWGQPMWASITYALGRVEKDWFWDEDDGGGPLLENAIHVFDLVRFLMGEVITVAAHGGNYFMRHRSPQLAAAAISLGMDSGGCASIGCGYGSEWGYTRERASFATATHACDVVGPFDNPTELRFIRRMDPKDEHVLDFEEPSGFTEEIEEFLLAIHEHRDPAVTGADAMESIAVALAVKRSIHEGRVVHVSEMLGD